jgi:hypothetical protein
MKVNTGQEIFEYFNKCAKEGKEIKVKSVEKSDRWKGDYIADLYDIVIYTGMSTKERIEEDCRETLNKINGN